MANIKITALLRNKWLWISLGVAGAAAGLAPFLFKGGDGEVVYTASPKRQPVTLRLVESGTLDSESSVNVIAPMVNRYRKLLVYLVPEGTVVKKGAVLAKCDTSDLERDLENQRLEIGNIRARYKDTQVQYEINLDDLKNRLEQKAENQKIAQMTLDQMAYAADIDRQKSQVSLNQAKMEVEFAKTRIRAEEGRRDTALRQIGDEISNAQTKIDDLNLSVERFTVLAPEDGLVVYPLVKIDGQERKIQVGDSLYYGQVFLTLPNLFRMIVKIEVSEDAIKKVQVGQKAEIVLEAWKDRVYHGVIVRLSNLAKVKENNRFIKVFTVVLKILEEDLERLKPGMNARVTVDLRRLDDAITIPLAFVDQQGGQAAVYGWDGKTITRQNVTLAEQTETLAVFTQPLPPRLIWVERSLKERMAGTNFDLKGLVFREYREGVASP